MNDSTDVLDALATKAGQLYSLPAVAMKVLELTDNPRVDVHALRQCIENDPALMTKVLRVVNSSLFGLSREVSGLNQALALLGIKPLKLLVLGFSLPEGLFDNVAAEMLARYWRHTLTKAVAAREMSEAFWHQPGDEAFIAGLLQDLGTLAMIQQVGAPYVQFLKKVYDERGELLEWEVTAMGFNHTMLTSRLLHHWGLPDALAEAVCSAKAQTLDAPPGAAPSLADVLQLAELLAQLLADGRAEVLDHLLTVGQRRYGLGRQHVEKLVDTLEEKVSQLANVLALRLPEGRSYREVLLQAHQQLADVAAEAAEDLIRQGAGGGDAQPSNRPAAEELQALSAAVHKACRPEQASPAAPASDASNDPSATDVGNRPTSAPNAGSQAGRSLAADPDPGLLGQLAASVNACRKGHSPLTLMLVELEDLDDLVFNRGVEGLDSVRRLLENVCRGVTHPGAVCLPHRDAGFAVVLPDCERQQAVQAGTELIDHVSRLTSSRASSKGSAPSISVGAATLPVPSKNFPPQDLLSGAERCLYGSHTSGGGVVKSIEIY
ncbi:MAG: HDOD domain-containing protein [Planctomycetota bacterium]|jgi:HD-like signal output (HDOD) protein/GGDEF domain-containing protein